MSAWFSGNRWSVMTLALAGVANVAWAADPGDAVCRRASGQITIDGKLDDAAWKQADVIDGFFHPAVTPRSPAKTQTKARLLWDDEALYFAAHMEDADLFATIAEQDGNTWENDVFELFFKPDAKREPYYEFQVNPLNTHFDCCFLSLGGERLDRWKKAHEFRWETKLVLNGTLNDKSDKDTGWSVEGRIPWNDFRHTGGKPKAGDIWRFALCRYDYSAAFKSPDLSSTAPLTKVDYHQTEKYGRLTFEEK